MKKIIVAVLAVATMIAITGSFAPTKASEPEAQSRAEKKALFRRGAKLWPMYCSQCHPARFGAEFSPPQWDVIMAHMRARANLSGEDSRAVLEFLRSGH